MNINIKPDLSINARPGESLLETLIRNEIPVKNICGGKGNCGKCKVKFTAKVPDPSEKDIKLLNPAEIAAGIRLACSVQPEDGMEIEIEYAEIYDRKEATILNIEESFLNTGMEKIFVKLPTPSLTDERGDWDRLRDELIKYINKPLDIDMDMLRILPGVLRAEKFKVTATLWGNRLLDLDKGDTSKFAFGIALDIGTTSVAAALVNLNTGQVVKVLSLENAQTIYGADVISRISYAVESREKARQLRQAIKKTINKLISKLTCETGVKSKYIYIMTVVANTCMHHLFLGLDVSNLAESPYISACNSALNLSAGELDVEINPRGRVLLFPNIAGFVGGDTIGAILGTPEILDDGNHLLIDLGTNCELFLKTRNEMVACSTAAGPAFEGVGISYGMRAKPGAIEGVRITGHGVEVKVIGNKEPIGICGSGLIQAIAQMKKADIINKQGTIKNPLEENGLTPEIKNLIRPGKNGMEFILYRNSSEGFDVVLNQEDIRRLQLAKAAVCAGIQTILELANISPRDLDSVILSGTFATYLDVRSILEIGLIPNVSLSKLKSVGNAAIGGAIRALLNHNEFIRAGILAKKIKHIELGGYKKFNEHFIQNMYFEITE